MNFNRFVAATVATRAVRAVLALTLVSSYSSPSSAQSTPAEKTRAQVTRNAQSSLKLETELSKNVFRTESREVPYEVKVPYQTTETYTENVPYTVSEPYTDTETVWENEHVCRDVSRSDRQCRNEQVCSTEPTTERQCSVEQICRDGQNGPVCVQREVCREVGGGGRRVCRDNYVCRDVPVRDRECRYERVPRTRTVTKYRDVTRYRSETRTRTVTKHRTESRCCKTETVQVFDRQYKVPVVVNFPAESQLQAAEIETLKLELAGTEAAPEANVTIESPIFKYEVANRQVSGGAVLIDLKLVPKFDASELGKGTLTQLKLMPTTRAAAQRVVFVDAGLRGRIVTTYALSIVEVATGAVVHEAQVASSGQQKMEIPVPVEIQRGIDYLLRLEVGRVGPNLSAPVQFIEEVAYNAKRLKPEDVGPKTVSRLSLRESGAAMTVRFTDLGTLDGVETLYLLNVMDTTKNVPVHTEEIDGATAISDKNVVILQFPTSKLNARSNHKVTVRVKRSGSALQAPVVFAIDASLPSKISNAEDLRNEAKVALLRIEGIGELAMLAIEDQTNAAGAATTYQLEVRQAGKLLGTSTIERGILTTEGNVMRLPLRMAVAPSTLNAVARPGASVEITVRVSRSTREIGTVSFAKQATLVIQ